MAGDWKPAAIPLQYKLKRRGFPTRSIVRHNPQSMMLKICPVLALSMALIAVADPPSQDPLTRVRTGSYSHAPGFKATATLLNWNIDRGQHLDGIEAAIRSTKPDLCILQEVDLGARRTDGRDIALELARTFGLNYSFAPEFQELSQSIGSEPAYHGQAILTTWPILNTRILRFEHQSRFWKPRPLLISSLPILQRREGGRIAQVSELDNGGKKVVVYNLHLESRGSENGRLLQLNEVLADAERYSEGTAVIIAGDFNTKSWHSPLIDRLKQAGYRNSWGDRRIRTHMIIGALDWVFVRGPIQCEDARVLRHIGASDHFPISLDLKF
jgi:endonuclease/exonuclease/phosphatase family metal-dependent hydrolase